jgi:hypothetical protein
MERLLPALPIFAALGIVAAFWLLRRISILNAARSSVGRGGSEIDDFTAIQSAKDAIARLEIVSQRYSDILSRKEASEPSHGEREEDRPLKKNEEGAEPKVKVK